MYAPIDYKISEGVKGSMADQVFPNQTPKGQIIKTPVSIYQGHGIPLPHEDPNPIHLPEKPMFIFQRNIPIKTHEFVSRTSTDRGQVFPTQKQEHQMGR